LAGAGSGGGLLIIIGVVLVLIAVTIMTYGAGSTIVDPLIGSAGAGFGTTAGIFGSYTGMIAFSTLLMGASMIVGGISALLTHDPTAQTNTASLLFNGAVNTTEQGVPVPVGYGELIVGSATISAGVSTQQIPVGISAGLYSYAN
jgi:predicted phage tail protein